MAAQYINVTVEEMDAFLAPQGFKQIDLRKFNPNDRTSEIVYSKRVDRNGFFLSLRVYTGINPSGQSRDVGADAMRASLFLKVWNKDHWEITCLGGSKRVHRVVNWRINLQDRLDNWLTQFKVCPKCGMPLMLKKNRTTKKSFLGCTGYKINECRYAESN
jgi:hypothetical protein